jgi:hypothetical protein
MPAACLGLGGFCCSWTRVSKHTDCSFDFDLLLLNRTFRCFSVCLFVCVFVPSVLVSSHRLTDRQTAKKAGSPVLLLLRLLPAGSVGHELLSFARVLFILLLSVISSWGDPVYLFIDYSGMCFVSLDFFFSSFFFFFFFFC